MRGKGLLPFQNKVALVTNSGSGVGRAVALHLAHKGASVVLNYAQDPRQAEKTVVNIQKFGGKALAVRASLTDHAQITCLVDTINEHFHRLDIFIANFPFSLSRPIARQKTDDWDWTLDHSSRAYLFTAQRAVTLMERTAGGYIVSISQASAGCVIPEKAVEGAASAAVESITRYLAAEYGTKNIIVNGIRIANLQTEDEDGKWSPNVNPQRDSSSKVTYADVAGAVSMLCAGGADMIRGQIITVDGGASLYYRP